MDKIDTFGDEAKQKITMFLDNGERVVFSFEYRPNQLGWFVSYEYKDHKQSNIRLVTNYNILRTYSNYLPFGLRCDTIDKEEPMDLDDFSSGYASVFLLQKDDIQNIEANFYAE